MEDARAQTIKRFGVALAIVVGAGALLGFVDRLVPPGVGQSTAFGMLCLVGLVGSWFAGFQLLLGAPPAAGLLRATLLVLYVPTCTLSLMIPLLYSCMYLGDCL